MDWLQPALFETVLVVLQSLRWGCPDVDQYVTYNFDVDSYQGVWYDIYHYPTTYQMDCSCVTANYTLKYNSKGDQYVEVDNSCYLEEEDKWRHALGKATIPDRYFGKLLVTFPESELIEEIFGTKTNYNVLSVDYGSSVLVYSCSSYLGIGYQSAWFLSREKYLDEYTRENYNEILEDLGLKTGRMVDTSHENCPVEPPNDKRKDETNMDDQMNEDMEENIYP